MKKIIGIALVLALVLTMGLGTVALADDPVTTVSFEGSNPDITVSSRFAGAHGLEDGVSLFTLQGTGYAEGFITASASPTGGQWGPWGSAEISGWFNAEGSNFNSFFGSMMTELGTGGWHVAQEGYNEHSLSATGVTSLYVEGWALSTSYNNVESPGASQLFVGEVDTLTALGISLLKWDSDNDRSPDTDYGASIRLFVDGVETNGFTASNRSLYPDPWGSHLDEGSLEYRLYSGDADLLTADLFTNYSHIDVYMTPFELWGTTSAQ